jgi:arylsulfatase A-like enzyme
MMGDDKLPGYRGELGKDVVTIAEVMKLNGYSCYMAGKWHVTPYRENIAVTDSMKHNWPLQRGFDRFYGTIHGGGSFWDPNTLTRDNDYVAPDADPEYFPEHFYYTDAISDHAVRFVEEQDDSRPFFRSTPQKIAGNGPDQKFSPDVRSVRGLGSGETPQLGAEMHGNLRCHGNPNGCGDRKDS